MSTARRAARGSSASVRRNLKDSEAITRNLRGGLQGAPQRQSQGGTNGTDSGGNQRAVRLQEDCGQQDWTPINWDKVAIEVAVT